MIFFASFCWKTNADDVYWNADDIYWNADDVYWNPDDVYWNADDVYWNADDVYWNVWTNFKKMYAQNNIFKKRIVTMRFWIIYILVQISFFGGLL